MAEMTREETQALIQEVLEVYPDKAKKDRAKHLTVNDQSIEQSKKCITSNRKSQPGVMTIRGWDLRLDVMHFLDCSTDWSLTARCLARSFFALSGYTSRTSWMRAWVSSLLKAAIIALRLGAGANPHTVAGLEVFEGRVRHAATDP